MQIAVWLNSFGAPFSEHTGIFFFFAEQLFVCKQLPKPCQNKVFDLSYFIWLFFDYILPSLLYR